MLQCAGPASHLSGPSKGRRLERVDRPVLRPLKAAPAPPAAGETLAWRAAEFHDFGFRTLPALGSILVIAHIQFACYAALEHSVVHGNNGDPSPREIPANSFIAVFERVAHRSSQMALSAAHSV